MDSSVRNILSAPLFSDEFCQWLVDLRMAQFEQLSAVCDGPIAECVQSFDDLAPALEDLHALRAGRRRRRSTVAGHHRPSCFSHSCEACHRSDGQSLPLIWVSTWLVVPLLAGDLRSKRERPAKASSCRCRWPRGQAQSIPAKASRSSRSRLRKLVRPVNGEVQGALKRSWTTAVRIPKPELDPIGVVAISLRRRARSYSELAVASLWRDHWPPQIHGARSSRLSLRPRTKSRVPSIQRRRRSRSRVGAIRHLPFGSAPRRRTVAGPRGQSPTGIL